MTEGIELAAPDFNTFYTPGEKGYNDYPAAPQKRNRPILAMFSF